MINWNEMKKKVGFKNFPNDYLEGMNWEKVMEIPKGKDIFMYRETEEIYVIIDFSKFYFLDLALARFVQMCALTGNTIAPILSHNDASKAVRSFKNDMAKWESNINELLKGQS